MVVIERKAVKMMWGELRVCALVFAHIAMGIHRIWSSVLKKKKSRPHFTI